MPINTTTIFPARISSSPTIYSLSPVDHVMPRCYTRTAHCYRFSPSTTSGPSFTETVNLLKSSLSSTLSEYPILAGRLYQDPNNAKLRVQLSPDENHTEQFGVRFVVNQLDEDVFPSFTELEQRNFPISMLTAEALSPVGMFPGSSWMDQGAETLMVQVNLIKDGLIITICTHHSICDGVGHASFIRRWTELSRCTVSGRGGESGSRDSSIHDRSPLMPDHNSWTTVPQQEHVAYVVKAPPETPPPQSIPCTMPPMESVIFHITPERIQLLKSECTSLGESAVSISTNDAISALFWRVVSRIRLGLGRVSGDESGMLGMAVNARSRLNPPLHEEYFGNVNVFSATVLPFSTLVSPAAQLSTAAFAVHESVAKMNNDFIRSAVQLLHNVPNPSHVSPNFRSFLGKDVAITSWVHMGVYGHAGDFGFGEPVSVRIPSADFDGLGIIFPKKSEAGEGLELLVGLEKQCMLRMREDEEWARFFSIRAQ